LARDKDSPPCPACGSTATLPFEHEEDGRGAETFSEVILTVFSLLLASFSVFLAVIISHAGLPIALLMMLAILLLWRRKKENRRARPRPRPYICLDCNRSFKA
jgi:hypothetical protein